MIILDVSVNLIYYGPSLLLTRFHFSIYVNSLVVGMAVTLASILATFIIDTAPRRKTALISFSITLLASLILTFIWDQSQKTVSDTASKITVMFLIFVIEFSLTFEFDFFMLYLC